MRVTVEVFPNGKYRVWADFSKFTQPLDIDELHKHLQKMENTGEGYYTMRTAQEWAAHTIRELEQEKLR